MTTLCYKFKRKLYKLNDTRLGNYEYPTFPPTKSALESTIVDKN